MIYIAYLILTFLLLQLFVTVANAVFAEKLRLQKMDVSNVKLSVLIPARNEEKNIGNILSDLSKIKENITEILVYNDFSLDETENIIKRCIKYDNRVKVIAPKDLPENWLGKNFACHQLSLNAKGDYFLFIDADISVKNNSILSAIQYVKKNNIDLLSIFPVQKMMTFAEKITVPNMHYILLSLLFLPFVKLITFFPSLSASNGQFMLIKSDVYKEQKPHSTFKNSRAEDIEIARHFKRKRKKVSCVTGISDVSCRMYHSLSEAIDGFSKNVNYFFGNSYILSVIFLVITTFGFIPLYLVFGWLGILMFFVLQILIRIFVSVHSKQNIVSNTTLFVFQQIMLGVFIFKSIQYKITNNLEWKGRKI